MPEQRSDRLAHTLGEAQLERLQSSFVVVLGTGLLGGYCVLHLGMLGVRMLLVDCGGVDEPNLGNQLLPVAALGQSKVRARKAQVRAIDPGCRVTTREARLEDLGLGEFEGADLLLTGLDSRASRIAVREIAQRLAIPWVDAAVDGSGERLIGTVSCYDARKPETACHSCRYQAQDLATIAREGRGPGCPSWRGQDAPVTAPTLVASPFGSVVSGFQMLWAVRMLIGEGEDLAGQQLQISADGLPRTRTVALARSAHCAFDHSCAAPLLRAPGSGVGSLLVRAQADLGAPVEQLDFHTRVLAVGLECPCCFDRRDVVRIRGAFRDEELRCGCGATHELVPSRLTSVLEGDTAARLSELSWAELGLPVGEHVSASAAGRTLHYLTNLGA